MRTPLSAHWGLRRRAVRRAERAVSAVRVPLFDVTRQTEALLPELMRAVERTLRSGAYVLGPEVERFERECAAYVGTRHAIGVASGTDAIALALRAAAVGPGDFVL